MNFSIGLTDVDNLENFKYFDGSNRTVENFSYNLYTQSTVDEKASISWTLNDLPAVNNAIASYKSIKTKPHFTIINYATKENLLIPSLKDITCLIEVSGLLPSSNIFEDYTEEDIENTVTGYIPFGSLILDIMSSYHWAGIDNEETLEYAFENNNLDNLASYVPKKAAPGFNINFNYNPVLGMTTSKKMNVESKQWIELNKDKLIELGYEQAKWGTIIAGNLVGDPMEAYEKVNKYSKICRITIE